MSEASDRAHKALAELKDAMASMTPDEGRLFAGELLSSLTSMVMAPTQTSVSQPAPELE